MQRLPQAVFRDGRGAVGALEAAQHRPRAAVGPIRSRNCFVHDVNFNQFNGFPEIHEFSWDLYIPFMEQIGY